jgi:Single-stranded DNA binding protein Ssb-like, OB fold
LAFLTVKYDVHPDVLFCALLAAGEIGKTKCGPLSIEHRGKIDSNNYFLIKEDSEVIAQFPIPDELLVARRNPLRGYMETDMVKKCKAGEKETNAERSIQDLRPGMTHINLTADIEKITEPARVGTRYGNQVTLAKALIQNETGEINLCLWNEQIDAVSEGDHVQIENATVTKFRGKTQMTIGRTGSIRRIPKEENKNRGNVTEQVECSV